LVFGQEHLVGLFFGIVLGVGSFSSLSAGFFFFLNRLVSQFQKSFQSSFFSSQSKNGSSK